MARVQPTLYCLPCYGSIPAGGPSSGTSYIKAQVERWCNFCKHTDGCNLRVKGPRILRPPDPEPLPPSRKKRGGSKAKD